MWKSVRPSLPKQVLCAVILVLAPRSLAEIPKSQGPEEALAFVTKIAGGVSIVQPQSDRAWPAWHLQAVGDGATLKLAPHAELILVCKDGAVLEFTSSDVLTAKRCLEAKDPQLRGRIAALIPDRGRVKVFAGSLTLEGRTRDDKTDYGRRPVLLSPRCPSDEAHRLSCTSLSRTPEEIRWVAVPEADRYRLRLSSFPDVEVELGGLECEKTGDSAPYEICSIPWPKSWQMVRDRKVFLQIEAKIGLFDEATSENNKLELASLELTEKIGRELATLSGLDATTRQLLAATTYADNGLVNESIIALDQAVGTAPSAVLRVSMGDLYRRVDLLYPAVLQYKQALAQLDSGPDQPAVRIAATLGLAWANHLWGSSGTALEHARAALDLCGKYGLSDEDASKLLAKIEGNDSTAQAPQTNKKDPYP